METASRAGWRSRLLDGVAARLEAFSKSLVEYRLLIRCRLLWLRRSRCCEWIDPSLLFRPGVALGLVRRLLVPGLFLRRDNDQTKRGRQRRGGRRFAGRIRLRLSSGDRVSGEAGGRKCNDYSHESASFRNQEILAGAHFTDFTLPHRHRDRRAPRRRDRPLAA